MAEYAPLNTKTPTDSISKQVKDEYNQLLTESSKLNNKKLYGDLVNQTGYDNKTNNQTTINNKLALVAQTIDKNISDRTKENSYKNKLLDKSEMIIGQSQSVIDGSNQQLTNNLRTLDNISAEISTKDRLIQLNNIAMQRKKYNTAKLLATGVLALILANIYMFSGRAKMSTAKLIGITIALLVLYYLYVTYLYNYYGLKKPKFESPYPPLTEEQIKESRQKIKEDEFINENCDCPSDLQPGDDTDIKMDVQRYARTHLGAVKYGNKIPNNSGDYYYDGTAPMQKLEKPAKTPLNKDKPHFMIDWESSRDMGVRRTGKYMPGAGLDKDQLDTLGLSMEDTLRNSATTTETFSNPGDKCDIKSSDNQCPEDYYCFRGYYENDSQARCVTNVDPSGSVFKPGSRPGDYGLPNTLQLMKGPKTDEKGRDTSYGLGCARKATISPIQSASVNNKNSLQLENWMTPTSGL